MKGDSLPSKTVQLEVGAEEDAEDGKAHDAATRQIEEAKRVDQLAGEFATKVPELEFSPAEISSFLFEHRQSPGHAIDNVEIWMAKIQEDRGKLVINS